MASIRSVGKKAAKKVRKNLTKQDTQAPTGMTSYEGTSNNQNAVSCYGDWGGVSNSHTNGTVSKPKKK